jgi:uncharacterized membrane protein YdjX (TVP38/TMEM64 family)
LYTIIEVFGYDWLVLARVPLTTTFWVLKFSVVEGTFLGIMPGTFTLVYFGDSLASLSVIKIIAAVVLIIILGFLGRYIIKRNK